MKIPEDYIEDAEEYAIIPNDSKGKMQPIPIGGRIMKNLVIREQMTIDNIVMTAGDKNRCIVLVDYPTREVLQFIKKAKQYMDTLINHDSN